MIDINQIIENLRQVHDPEISVNVFDLGLIYNIEIHDKDPHFTNPLSFLFLLVHSP